MNKLWDVVIALFWIAYFVGYAVNNYWDFTHPGREPHWMHNPWWNAVGGVALFLVVAVGYWSDWRAHRRKTCDARLVAMKDVVRSLLEVGRREEAEKASALCRRFEAAASEQEKDRLVNAFITYLTPNSKGVLP